jgi:hypothetical protein
MNPNDKYRATVVRWTCASDLEEAKADAVEGNTFAEGYAKEMARRDNNGLWKITMEITVERMPNEETT